ncbi:MAG: glycoside hydrolase family 66 protein [Chloroflexota bacterium]
MTRLSIGSFGPRRSWVRPGQPVAVDAEIIAAAEVRAEMTVTLLDLDRVVGTVRRRVALGPSATQHTIRMELPPRPRHGYGLSIRVASAEWTATASSAIEALDGWWQSPRHTAMTDYQDPQATDIAMRDLVRWHVTVVQHYDWMWRHYRYRPPDGATTFADTLGREVSHDAVHAGIRAGHAVGIASLAYGSVYGAEAEHVERYPDDRVFDEHGEPLSLGGTFFINDLRSGSPWRRRLLAEYSGAIRRFGFDGIHMDSYGAPHAAVSADGEAIDFAALYPDLITEAAGRVAAAHHGARVVFNCVEGFPLQSVARAPTACLYLELWPPDRAFSDVVRWVGRARAVAEGRQVVIAAYAATLREVPSWTHRQEAAEAVLQLGTVIAVAGAYHHILAERDRVLVEGYYPAAVALRAAEAREMRALWRFTARYVHLLSDPRRAVANTHGLCVLDADGRTIVTSSRPLPGTIWAVATSAPGGQRVLHLVDLRDQEDEHWDSPKHRPRLNDGLRLHWPLCAPVAASPWSAQGDAGTLRLATAARGGVWVLPPFRRWLMIVEAEDHAPRSGQSSSGNT